MPTWFRQEERGRPIRTSSELRADQPSSGRRSASLAGLHRRGNMTSPKAQYTDFSKDVLGRYVCNGLDEALRSADPGGHRPDGSTQEDARPFDVIVVGGGSFGPIMAQHLFNQD